MPTSQFTDVTKELFAILIFKCLVSIFYTGSLWSFKAKVISVLFQLESPNSEHRNSNYVQSNSDYSMIKTKIRIWLAHGPNWTEFLSHLEQEFDNSDYFVIKTEIKIWLAHRPNLSEFLSHLEQEFDNVYFNLIFLFEVYFNWPLESLKSDKK